jgi:ribosome-binding ATPase YchF (GTP1/OBG family)
MLIGLVGKPSCGKSTFFKASTLSDVLIASYPFATIKPNVGVACVKIDCIEDEFDARCDAQKGYCVDGNRFVPFELMDVAGLVAGASEGKGLGNQFLDDLSGADAFIHVVDVSGETDSEGKESKNYDPLLDVEMLEKELDLWYLGILDKVWKVFSRTVQNTKGDFAKAVAKQFSGLKVSEDDVKDVLRKGEFDVENPSKWDEGELLKFAHELRHLTKPMIIAANKIDKEKGKENLKRLREKYDKLMIVGCSADLELALREANEHKLIKYIPGSDSFEIIGELNEKQSRGLEGIRAFLKDNGSTGVQEVLNKVVFELLGYLTVFPASANNLKDSKGNVLPDCFLLRKGSTALDFAYKIHKDLGDNFIKAIDARTSRAVGKEYEVKDRDALEIMTR